MSWKLMPRGPVGRYVNLGLSIVYDGSEEDFDKKLHRRLSDFDYGEFMTWMENKYDIDHEMAIEYGCEFSDFLHEM